MKNNVPASCCFLLLCRTFKHDVSSNARAMLKLTGGADMVKHSLSLLGAANCFVDSLHDGLDFECTVSRSLYSSPTNPQA